MIERLAKIFLLAAFSLVLSSCEKSNPCANVVCALTQQCINGTCYCKDGYEGANCDQYAYTKYERSYYLSESCVPMAPFSSGNPFIQHNSNDIRQLFIYNLLGGNCTYIVAIIQTDLNNQGNTLYIPLQSNNCASGSVSGTGYYNPSANRVILQLDYAVTNGTDYQCTETLY